MIGLRLQVNNVILLEDLGKQMIILFCTNLNKKIGKAELKQLVKFEWFAPKFQKTVVDDELNRNDVN
jgi:hypothetical protein